MAYRGAENVGTHYLRRASPAMRDVPERISTIAQRCNCGDCVWRKRWVCSIAASMNDGTLAVITADTTMTDQFSNVTFAYRTWTRPTRCRDVCWNSCQCLMKRFMDRRYPFVARCTARYLRPRWEEAWRRKRLWNSRPRRAAPEAEAQRTLAASAPAPRGSAACVRARAAPEQCNQCAIKWEQRWEDRRASCVPATSTRDAVTQPWTRAHVSLTSHTPDSSRTHDLGKTVL